MNRDVKSDENILNQVRSILRKYFDKILIAYKYLAGQLGANIPQISESTILDFINNCGSGLLNNKYVSNDVLLQATTVKGYDMDERTKLKNKNVPNNIIRHQFLYLLVKISTSQHIRINDRKH